MIKVKIVERVSSPQWRKPMRIDSIENKYCFKEDINTERLGS
jgi:hypothetical protein